MFTLDAVKGKLKQIVRENPTEITRAAVVFAGCIAMYALGRYHGKTTINLYLQSSSTSAYEHAGTYPVSWK